jgi:ketosteroid isomerase-like protein
MKTSALGIFLFAATLMVRAQSRSAEDSAIVAIRMLTQVWNKAIIDRDSLTLARVMSPDYTINGTFPLKDWLNNTLHHFTTDSLQTLGEQKITIYGDIASAEAPWYWKASWDGVSKVNTEYWVNDIWKKNNGHWQVFIRMTKVTKERH